MNTGTTYEEIRLRNKIFLVERVLRMYPPEGGDVNVQKELWVKKLYGGYDIAAFLRAAKSGVTLSLAEEADQKKSNKQGYAAIVDDDLDFHAGLKRKLLVEIKNESNKAFFSSEKHPLFMSYHWYKQSGEMYEYDGIRTPLAHEVNPAEKSTLKMDVAPPSDPGAYKLEVTMVLEGKHWMEEVGFRTQIKDVVVHEYEGEEISLAARRILELWDGGVWG